MLLLAPSLSAVFFLWFSRQLWFHPLSFVIDEFDELVSELLDINFEVRSNGGLFNFKPLVITADFVSAAALISTFPLLVPE